MTSLVAREIVAVARVNVSFSSDSTLSVPVSVVGCTAARIATGASEASLAAASEFSLAVARVAVVEAGLELDSFFSTGLLVSVGVAFGACSDFSVSAFSSFFVSAFASLFSVVAGFSATSAFSVAGADVSEVATGVDRSSFGTGAPSP